MMKPEPSLSRAWAEPEPRLSSSKRPLYGSRPRLQLPAEADPHRYAGDSVTAGTSGMVRDGAVGDRQSGKTSHNLVFDK
jgi:hypothetical protein